MEVCEYRDSYNSYAYLWVDDRQEFLQQFLLYGHMLTQEEIEAAGIHNNYYAWEIIYVIADFVSSLFVIVWPYASQFTKVSLLCSLYAVFTQYIVSA